MHGESNLLFITLTNIIIILMSVIDASSSSSLSYLKKLHFDDILTPHQYPGLYSLSRSSPKVLKDAIQIFRFHPPSSNYCPNFYHGHTFATKESSLKVYADLSANGMLLEMMVQTALPNLGNMVKSGVLKHEYLEKWYGGGAVAILDLNFAYRKVMVKQFYVDIDNEPLMVGAQTLIFEYIIQYNNNEGQRCYSKTLPYYAPGDLILEMTEASRMKAKSKVYLPGESICQLHMLSATCRCSVSREAKKDCEKLRPNIPVMLHEVSYDLNTLKDTIWKLNGGLSLRFHRSINLSIQTIKKYLEPVYGAHVYRDFFPCSSLHIVEKKEDKVIKWENTDYEELYRPDQKMGTIYDGNLRSYSSEIVFNGPWMILNWCYEEELAIFAAHENIQVARVIVFCNSEYFNGKEDLFLNYDSGEHLYSTSCSPYYNEKQQEVFAHVDKAELGLTKMYGILGLHLVLYKLQTGKDIMKTIGFDMDRFDDPKGYLPLTIGLVYNSPTLLFIDLKQKKIVKHKKTTYSLVLLLNKKSFVIFNSKTESL